MECIILAGGKGTRLGMPDTPKALVEINGRTILERRIEWLAEQGIKHFILAIGYKKEKIKDFFNKQTGNLRFSFAEENEDSLLGTAGAIKNAFKLVEGDEAFVTNVDDITDIKLEEVMEKGVNIICLSRFRSPFGIVFTAGDDVVYFKEKPLLKDLWASCGFYYLSKHNDYPEVGSIEKDVFPFIDLKAYKHFGSWITVNTQKNIQEAGEVLK